MWALFIGAWGSIAIASTSFCTHPKTFICTPRSRSVPQSERNYRHTFQVLSDRALQETTRELGRPPQADTAPKFPKKLKDLSAWWGRFMDYRVYQIKYLEQLKPYFSDLERRALVQQRSRALILVRKAIQAEISDKALARTLSNSLDDVQWEMVTDVVEGLLEGELTPRKFEESAALFRKISHTCGSDLLSQNAFYRWSGNQPKLVICLGTLLGARNDFEDAEAAFTESFRTIAHELGHHLWYIMRKKQPSAVSHRVLDCLRPRYGLDRLKSETSGKVTGHASEVMADFWASKAWDQLLGDFSASEAMETVLRTFERRSRTYCDSPDDGAHPPGDLRIKMLTDQMPILRLSAGCEAPSEPLCSFKSRF